MTIRYYRVLESYCNESFNTRSYILTFDGIEEPGCHVVAMVYTDGSEPYRLREENGKEYVVQLSMEAAGYGLDDIEVTIELGDNNAA